MFGALKLHNHQAAMRSGKNQPDIYLDEPNLEMEYYEDLDVLKWWKDTQKWFPDLSIIARDLLRILITTVASKSAFSIGARVLNKYRSRPLLKNFQALIYTRNWLHDFVSNDKDGDGEDGGVREETSVSRGASNVIDLEDIDN